MTIAHVTLILATLLLAVVNSSLAILPDQNTNGFIQADQCDQSRFKACATIFFAQFGLNVSTSPTNMSTVLVVMDAFAERFEQDPVKGVQAICNTLKSFADCSSTQCWTVGNFKTVVSDADANFISLFKTLNILCSGDTLNQIIQYGPNCFAQISLDPNAAQKFRACADNLNLDFKKVLTLQGIMQGTTSDHLCSEYASALSCIVKTLEKYSACPASFDQALCQMNVAAMEASGQCQSQLDTACDSASSLSTMGIWATTTTLIVLVFRSFFFFH